MTNITTAELLGATALLEAIQEHILDNDISGALRIVQVALNRLRDQHLRSTPLRPRFVDARGRVEHTP